MTLEARIAKHRKDYEDDLTIPKLVASQPPTTLDPNTGALFQEPASALGMTLSARLLRFVGSPAGYGEIFPWSRGFHYLRPWCRHQHNGKQGNPRHYGERVPFWRGSLCHEAVRLTVKREYTPLAAARLLRITVDDLEQVLGLAFGKIDQVMDESRGRIMQREKLDAGVYQVGEQTMGPHRPMYGCECRRCAEALAGALDREGINGIAPLGLGLFDGDPEAA